MKNSYLNLLQQSSFNVNYWLMENRNFDCDLSYEYQSTLDTIKYTRYNIAFPENDNNIYINETEKGYLEFTEEEINEMLVNGEITEENIEEAKNNIVSEYNYDDDLSNFQMVVDVVSKIKIEKDNALEAKINRFNMVGKVFA